MCLITYSPTGRKILDWDTLNYSAKHMNDDGFGIAWFDRETEVWQIMKSMRPKRLRAAIGVIPADAPVIIHQRYATHGSKSMDNVHPFPIGESGAHLFHNGTISGTRSSTSYGTFVKGEWVKPKGSSRSDTVAYIQDELAPWVDSFRAITRSNSPADILLLPAVQAAIKARIGGNVLTITIPGNPEPVIIGEDYGTWEKGLWYSNSYSRPKAYDDNYGGGYTGGYYSGENSKAWDEYYKTKYGDEYASGKTATVCRLEDYSKKEPSTLEGEYDETVAFTFDHDPDADTNADVMKFIESMGGVDEAGEELDLSPEEREELKNLIDRDTYLNAN